MRRLLIDTDPGVDDSMMIQLALASPEVRVEALTTVFGNSDVDTTTRNALTNLDIAGRTDIPVARGAAKPLTRPAIAKYPVHVHGDDGLGNARRPSPRGAAIATPAASLIVERVMQSPGELTLLAVGPLTNLALAVSLEPVIAGCVREVVVMGGAIGRGNVSPTAESNVHHDPEAARIVFHAGWPITMVGPDVTTKTLMTADRLERLHEAHTRVTDFLAAITPFYFQYHSGRLGRPAMPVHDSTALAYVLDGTLFTTQALYVDVEVRGELTTGQTIADVRGQLGREPNVTVCVDVNADRVLELYVERLTRARPASEVAG